MAEQEDYLEGTAGETIARFRNGAEKQLMMATDRLETALAELRRGEFVACEQRLQEAGSFISALAQGERAFARLERETDIIAVEELEPGVTLVGYGPILDVEQITRGRRSFFRISIEQYDGEREPVLIEPDRKVLIELPVEGGS